MADYAILGEGESAGDVLAGDGPDRGQQEGLVVGHAEPGPGGQAIAGRVAGVALDVSHLLDDEGEPLFALLVAAEVVAGFAAAGASASTVTGTATTPSSRPSTRSTPTARQRSTTGWPSGSRSGSGRTRS